MAAWWRCLASCPQADGRRDITSSSSGSSESFGDRPRLTFPGCTCILHSSPKHLSHAPTNIDLDTTLPHPFTAQIYPTHHPLRRTATETYPSYWSAAPSAPQPCLSAQEGIHLWTRLALEQMLLPRSPRKSHTSTTATSATTLTMLAIP